MIHDEIRRQQAKLKDMTLKQKIGYVIYYYKWHILIVSALIIFLISFIHGYVTQKEEVFFMEVINSSVPSTDDPDLISAFEATAENYDPARQKMTVDYSYIDLVNTDYLSMTNDQKVVAMLTAGTIDAMIAPPDVTDKYIATECFCDLREVLPKDLLDRLTDEGYEFYYDKNSKENTSDASRVPIGVIISNTPVIKSGYIDNNGIHQMYYKATEKSYPIYSVMFNSAHQDRAVDYLYYLLEDK